jgi:hypothetical protein
VHVVSQHPLNLGLRFLLELAVWGAMGYWGWTQGRGPWRWLLALGFPLLAMTLWGVFRVPGDGGPPVVAVPGWVRLLLELFQFGVAVGLLIHAGHVPWALVLAVLLILHNALSYDRILTLLAVG